MNPSRNDIHAVENDWVPSKPVMPRRKKKKRNLSILTTAILRKGRTLRWHLNNLSANVPGSVQFKHPNNAAEDPQSFFAHSCMHRVGAQGSGGQDVGGVLNTNSKQLILAQ